MQKRSIVRVPLSKGYEAVIDAADADSINPFKWSYSNGYAMRGSGPRAQRVYTLMHRYLLDAPPDMQVDHINGDRLDNRRSNLRLCTSAQNQANRRGNRSASSRYKGVVYTKQRDGWVAAIGGQHLGLYDLERDAALAYAAAALELHKEFARIDFDPAVVPPLDEMLSRRRLWDGSSSTYRGVLWYAPRNAWRASIKVAGRTMHLGYFESEEDAARAFDVAALERERAHGVKARLNFPDPV